MKFKFIGKYTGASETVTVSGVTFTGHESENVTDEAAIAKLSGNPDFAKVTGPAKKADAE